MNTIRVTPIPESNLEYMRNNLIKFPIKNNETKATLSIPSNETKSTLSIPSEDVELIIKILEKAKFVNPDLGSGTISNATTYNDKIMESEGEIRREVQMYKKAVNGFISFGSIGLISFTVFATLGFAGELSLFKSLFGSILTGLITLGIFIDFKKWEKNHA